MFRSTILPTRSFKTSISKAGELCCRRLFHKVQEIPLRELFVYRLADRTRRKATGKDKALFILFRTIRFNVILLIFHLIGLFTFFNVSIHCEALTEFGLQMWRSNKDILNFEQLPKNLYPKYLPLPTHTSYATSHNQSLPYLLTHKSEKWKTLQPTSILVSCAFYVTPTEIWLLLFSDEKISNLYSHAYSITLWLHIVVVQL